ncbi:MAG TPA: DUF4233 domain-containing protein [Pseudonocardiaceae bacterium]
MTGAAAPPDPWKGLRGVQAGTLFMEAIVVGLALLVVAKLGGGPGSAAGWTVGLLAIGMLLAAFIQGRPYGLPVALVLQVAMIACWPVVPTLGALGLIFALVWVYLLWLRRDLTRRLAEHNRG